MNECIDDATSRRYFLTLPVGRVQLPYDVQKTVANNAVYSDIAVADLRDSLGLFNDNTFDDLLNRYLLASTRAVEKYIGLPLLNTIIRCYYLCPSQRLVMPFVYDDSDLETLSLTVETNTGFDYYGYERQLRPNFPGHVDKSIRRKTLIYITDTNIFENLSSEYVAPVRTRISYTLAGGDLDAQIGDIKEAIYYLAGQMFESRSGVFPPKDKIYSILEMYVGHRKLSVVGGA